jgi:CRP-like cAMP-binding protein
LLCDGLVKLFHAGADGRDHILEVLAPGVVLGELSLDHSEFLSISAQALTDARLLYLPRARVGWLVARHPLFAARVAQALSSGLARARRKSRDLALKSAMPRLATVLLSVSVPHHGDDGPYRPFRYTRRDLAAMAGTTPETVIRLLSRLRTRGVVTTKGRNIAVVDRAALRRLAAGDASETAARRSEPIWGRVLMTGPPRRAVR